MALSSRTKNKLVDQINMSFDSTAGTKMPRNPDNRAPAAWKLFLANHLVARAHKFKEAAEQEAVRDGVIFDKVKEPRAEGTNELIYNDGTVGVMLEVRRASMRVDPDKLIDYLSAAGVSKDMLNEGLRLATKPTRAAHVFTTFLVTEDTSGK